MPEIHQKFRIGGASFGVVFTGRFRGISRDLKLYRFDGTEWNHLETESQSDSFIGYPGEVSEKQMEKWGRRKAEWYVDAPEHEEES
jgi:hypothetical protein